MCSKIKLRADYSCLDKNNQHSQRKSKKEEENQQYLQRL